MSDFQIIKLVDLIRLGFYYTFLHQDHWNFLQIDRIRAKKILSLKEIVLKSSIDSSNSALIDKQYRFLMDRQISDFDSWGRSSNLANIVDLNIKSKFKDSIFGIPFRLNRVISCTEIRMLYYLDIIAREKIDLKSKLKIVDVGPGYGLLALILERLELIQGSYVGIDLPNMIRIQKDFYVRQRLHYKSAPKFIDITEAICKNEFDQDTIFLSFFSISEMSKQAKDQYLNLITKANADAVIVFQENWGGGDQKSNLKYFSEYHHESYTVNITDISRENSAGTFCLFLKYSV